MTYWNSAYQGTIVARPVSSEVIGSMFPKMNRASEGRQNFNSGGLHLVMLAHQEIAIHY
jgi:hypothetical protein